jgi:hypothetical protein
MPPKPDTTPIRYEMAYGVDPASAQSARIKAMFLDKRCAVRPQTFGKASTLRERILKASMFSNIYN